MWRRSTLLQGSQTPEEAAQDPYSPTFGQFRYDINAIEPGLNLSTPLGRFRNDRTFKQARINLLKAFEGSNKVKGTLTPDRNFRSIAMMGPAFIAFFTTAKQVEDGLYDRISLERSLAGLPDFTDETWSSLQREFYKLESDTMRDWLVQNTGEDPETITDMLAGLFAAAGTTNWVQVGTEFGREMAIRSRENQERREIQRVEDQRTARDQARERSRFWREWRQKQLEAERREYEGAQGTPQVPQGAPQQVGSSAAMDELGGLGMGGPAPSTVPMSAAAMGELGSLGEGPVSAPPPTPRTAGMGSGLRKISSFRGPHFFLSNMYDVPITIMGATYPRVENAFHSLKTAIPEEKAQFLTASGFAAKSLGRNVTLEGDAAWWNEQRVPVMLELLRMKFSNPDLRQMLLDTGDAILEEGPPANDQFWGVVNGRGQNMLGKLLMQVRNELRTRSNGRRRF